MQKYFISSEDFDNKMISGDDAYHIKTVMRFKINDNVLVCFDKKTYLVKLTNIEDKKVSFEIISEQIGNHELPVFAYIFQGYPKGDKLEEIIKHGTELGAYEFIPTIMKRSLFKLDEKKKDSKLARFNKIAKEAAEQSYRDIVPVVSDIKKLKEIDFSQFDVKIVCYEESAKNMENIAFKTQIKSLCPNDNVAIVIGPEGGIAEDEISYLEKQGFIPCSLGKRILRTETVVFYCLSAIGYEMELKNE